ncbi:hypothetical protein [Kitasatospora sp. NPDC056181]|uniref:hypothetical protein n=1 Tax=Kitasatospora sp. NPDC056181 TaxID=3345737 RepID=UPI0035E16BED
MSAVPHLPPTAEALITDGTTVEIRPIAPSDRAAVLDLHGNRMSEESRRLRFFGAGRRAPELAAERLCGPVRPGLLALLDGTPALTTAHPDTPSVSGRTRVRACRSRPGIAVTPGTDFATAVAAITASGRGILPVVTAHGTVAGVVAASDLLAAHADDHAGRAVRGELHPQPDHRSPEQLLAERLAPWGERRRRVPPPLGRPPPCRPPGSRLTSRSAS